MREAQAVMDEALVSRTRVLAAFAVTVGSDAAVADLMGLNEREVRVARRTVGKEDARVIADQLLSQPTETTAHPAPPVSHPAEASSQPPVPVTDPEWELHAEAVRAPVPHPRADAESPLPSPLVDSGVSAATVTWTAGMDSVLQWSWQSGLDVQTVAEELGLSSKDLLMRAQVLAAEGLLTPKAPTYDTSQSGRHRRHNPMQYSPVPDSPETLYYSPSPYV
ncbi:hypothetical protein ACFP53_34735 [Streptomyces zhihengii]|uniref:hypothetical protein n=1 Tax=Streptomyces zhihengii TaxID=1818004 RepID=UPI001FD3CDBA|nr:hypothetical protein [Streptomyces zhihengii]